MLQEKNLLKTQLKEKELEQKSKELAFQRQKYEDEAERKLALEERKLFLNFLTKHSQTTL